MISIHPMLFFIKGVSKKTVVFDLFQYIQCYFLSCTCCLFRPHTLDFNTSNVIFYHNSRNVKISVIPYFNTSNVIFYRILSRSFCTAVMISIHPMLFFINDRSAAVRCGRFISIHPMLFFIWAISTLGLEQELFQYIQCYFLSQGILVAGLSTYDFNTSNVIFYR